MELDKINQLLEKYFEATATEAEERELRDYFAKGPVAPDHEAYAPMFSYFSEAVKERYTQQVPLKTRSRRYGWVSIAAAAVLMIGLYFGKQARDQREAEIAYQETRKALGLIAQNLDRGTEKVAYLGQFEQTKKKLLNND